MTPPTVPERVAVLGAGTIGVGAGVLFALRGSSVTLVVRRAGAVAPSLATVRGRLNRLREMDVVDDEQRRRAQALVTVSNGIPLDARFELVFEAITEELGAKQTALAAAEAALCDGGLITSTTSSLRVDELASVLQAPDRFAGWHWFNPADLLPLVEVTPGARSSRETVERLTQWSVALGKRPITLRHETPGFVANRLQYALLREAYALVEDGVCGFDEVDLAVTAGLGVRWAALGPFATMDLAGLDVHAEVCRQLFGELHAGNSLPTALQRLRESGATGAKGGAGILGSYPAERTSALEELRDRTIASLSPATWRPS